MGVVFVVQCLTMAALFLFICTFASITSGVWSVQAAPKCTAHTYTDLRNMHEKYFVPNVHFLH